MNKAIPKLKDDARKHEQKEEWEKAIAAYLEVLKIGEQGGDGADLDLPLYNRVGDLYVRLGRPSDAVKYYAQAADRYAEAGLYNNAIALCNKALRYDAGRLELLKKLGSYSASQGFFTDARRWYLEYAERATKRGQVDDALSALSDYANVHDEADIREMLARMMRDNGKKEQAVEEYKKAYALYIAAGEQPAADKVRAELQTVDPDADVTASTHQRAATASREQEQLPGYAEDDEPTAPAGTAVVEEEAPPAEEEATDAAVDTGGLEIEQTGLSGGLDTGEGAQYESMEIDSSFKGADSEYVATEDLGIENAMGVAPDTLPSLDSNIHEELPEDEGEHFDLPTLDDDEYVEPEEIPAELPGFDDYEAAPEDEAEVAVDPLPGFDDAPPSALVEVEEIAAELEPEPEPEPAPPPRPVAPPAAPPAKKKKEYVDLASFLEDDEEEEAEDNSTRFVVSETPPTGDEDKDFADVLAQFKSKIAESIPKEDAGSHYDLGIAFKEMGLIDEAIGEFQTALRAGQQKLKVYEELGSCFIQKQQYGVAITVLNRAAQMQFDDESELLGVYYSLGRAHEEMGQRAEAKAAYEKVVAIDIAFQDTTDRLSRL